MKTKSTFIYLITALIVIATCWAAKKEYKHFKEVIVSSNNTISKINNY